MAICFHIAISIMCCLDEVNIITPAVYCTFSVQPMILHYIMSSVLYRITEIIIEVHPRTGHEGPEGEQRFSYTSVYNPYFTFILSLFNIYVIFISYLCTCIITTAFR
jgi:hypothetical protein